MSSTAARWSCSGFRPVQHPRPLDADSFDSSGAGDPGLPVRVCHRLGNSRRLGVAIRYVAPSMKQISGDKLLVSHVSGKDEYGHFDVMPHPAGRLLEEDFDRARRNTEMNRGILYKDVKPELVKETRRA